MTPGKLSRLLPGSDRQGQRACLSAQAAKSAIPTVVALRQHFEQVRRSELDRLAFKFGLSGDTRGRVDEITRLIVEKLLLTPTEQLKSLGEAETIETYTETLTRLFGLPAAGAEDDAESTAQPKKVEPFQKSPKSKTGPR